MPIQPESFSRQFRPPAEACSMRDVSVIEINLADLDHNMRVLRKIVGPDCGICPIVKADAYGLGAARIAKRLAFDGADLLAVYTPDQAAELFKAAVGGSVLVLMPVREINRVDELYRGLVSDRLHLTIHDEQHLRDLIAMTDHFGVTIPVHLEVDTGMGRGGCAVEDAPGLLKTIAGCRRLTLAGIFSHFASADSDPAFTEQQMQAFEDLIEANRALIGPQCRIHVANSFAALRSQRFHKMMVRVGLAWAGYGVEWLEHTLKQSSGTNEREAIAPRGNAGSAAAGKSTSSPSLIPAARELRPIVTWRSRIVQIKTIEAGAKVGYGSTWTAQRRTVLGLIPVGYADGYPVGLGSRDDAAAPHATVPAAPQACVKIVGANVNDQPLGFAPVVGAVNMDQITVDLTDLVRPEVRGQRSEDSEGEVGGQKSDVRGQKSADNRPDHLTSDLRPLTSAPSDLRPVTSAFLGFHVELISPDVNAPNHLPTLARMAGTIPHEMLCRLNPRLKRTYVAPPTIAGEPAGFAVETKGRKVAAPVPTMPEPATLD